MVSGCVRACWQRGRATHHAQVLDTHALLPALDRGDISASYRPVVHLATGSLLGWQAVARWDDEWLGTRYGDEVAAVAATGDLVDHVELVVLDAALAALAAGDATHGASRLTMSVRMSALGLMRDDVTARIAAALELHGIAGKRLFVELADSVAPADVPRLACRLQSIRDLGAQIALAEVACVDSFSRVRGMPIDRLHLGACSTAQLERPAERAIVRAVLAMARDLSVDVMADGVGTDHQRRLLRRLGCPLGSGAVFGDLLRTPSAPKTHDAIGAGRRGYPVPTNEVARLSTVYDTGMLDSASEALFDDIAAEAARLCETPIALVTLVDVDRVFFKAAHGLGNLRQVGRHISFCSHAICEPGPMVVPDALVDPRFVGNPFVVEELGVRFYAGAPLVSSDGTTLGTVCVLDHRARALDQSQIDGLGRLARHAASHVELRARLHQLERFRQDQDVAKRALDELRRLIGSGPLDSHR